MAENDKLDLILSELREMKVEMCGTKDEVQGIKGEVQGLKEEMRDVKTDMREMKQRINRLEVGQSDIKRELYRMDRKISDTYNLALDAWGQGIENRVWLEGDKVKA